MKPGEKEMNTLLRNEASSLFFFKAPIRSRSPLLTGSRLISLPLATQMFQFAKFEKSKERRLAAELGYGFPIRDPWITDGISPWPFASESVLPSQCPSIQPMHSFRSCTHGALFEINAFELEAWTVNVLEEMVHSSEVSQLTLSFGWVYVNTYFGSLKLLGSPPDISILPHYPFRVCIAAIMAISFMVLQLEPYVYSCCNNGHVVLMQSNSRTQRSKLDNND
ncbi:hypothetical protein Tco_0740966 [Tanacetum coccineum]